MQYFGKREIPDGPWKLDISTKGLTSKAADAHTISLDFLAFLSACSCNLCQCRFFPASKLEFCKPHCQATKQRTHLVFSVKGTKTAVHPLNLCSTGSNGQQMLRFCCSKLTFRQALLTLHLLASSAYCTNTYTTCQRCLQCCKVLPVHNPVGLLQFLKGQRVRYDIAGLHSCAYEVNQDVAHSALYWNACCWLNYLFANHGSFKMFHFAMQCIKTRLSILQATAGTCISEDCNRYCSLEQCKDPD